MTSTGKWRPPVGAVLYTSDEDRGQRKEAWLCDVRARVMLILLWALEKGGSREAGEGGLQISLKTSYQYS